MSIANFLYGDLDIPEMLDEVQSNIIKVAWKILDDGDDSLNGVLKSLMSQRIELAQFLEEDGEVSFPELHWNDLAEEKYREIYVRVYRKMIPDGYTKEDDILDGYCAWYIEWSGCSFTTSELIEIAKCEIGKWKAVRRQLQKMHKENA
jgi:hypothetical protein